MIPISKMAAAVQPSATLAAGAKAKAMKAEGVHVHDFSLGEPDFTTPAHICQAANDAMKAGHTHYTPASGTAELRKTIAAWYGKTYGLDCTLDQVIVSNGAKHSIHNVLASIVGPGDDVVIPTPYWVSYSDLVQMTGATYTLVPTDHEVGFKMSPEQLKKAISPKTKLLMLNSPSNPTGAVYTKQELEALADVCIEADITILSDEIYEQLIYGDATPTCVATLRPGLAERTVTISGLSKTYAMTGWRIGWTVGPKHLIKAMGNVQSQQTGCPSSIAQQAAVAAITGDQQCVADMRKEFAARRDLVYKRLSAMPGVICPMPGGAFYMFFNVASYFGKKLAGKPVTDSLTFCTVALESAHVNLVAGAAFGAEGYARLSFANSREELNAGLDKLSELLKTAE